MIEAELVEHLTANVPSIGGRIYPVHAPQNPTHPYITYKRISDPRLYSLDGANGLVEARYQIESWSTTYADKSTTAEALRLALDGFSGVWGPFEVSRIRLEGGPDEYDPEVKIYRDIRDFIIRYAES